MPTWEQMTVSQREAKLRKKLHNAEQLIKKLVKQIKQLEGKKK